MRKLLNLTLLVTILLGNAEEAEFTLKFARENTMILLLTDEWVREALNVTKETGICKGDRKLLKVLLRQ